MTFCIFVRRSAVGVPPFAYRNLSRRPSAKSAELSGKFRLRLARSHKFSGALTGSAAEHDEIDQRIRTEPVGPVHRHTGGFADRHQAGHDHVGVVAALRQHLTMIVRLDATHVVVNGRRDRDRLARHIHARQRCARFPKCRAGARAGSPGLDGRGGGRYWSFSLPTPLPSRTSMVMARETMSRGARSFTDGA